VTRTTSSQKTREPEIGFQGETKPQNRKTQKKKNKKQTKKRGTTKHEKNHTHNKKTQTQKPKTTKKKIKIKSQREKPPEGQPKQNTTKRELKGGAGEGSRYSICFNRIDSDLISYKPFYTSNLLNTRRASSASNVTGGVCATLGPSTHHTHVLLQPESAL